MVRGGRVIVILNGTVRLAFNKKVRFEQRLKFGEGNRCAIQELSGKADSPHVALR